MRFPIYFLILTLLLCSCRSTLNSKNSVPSDAPIYAVSQAVQEGCFSTPKPSFLAVISTLQNTIPPFQIEGAWRAHFTTLELKFIGILGEDYGKITLDVASETAPLPALLVARNPRFIPLFAFIKELKPFGVRQLMCGHNAFFSEEKAAALYTLQTENPLAAKQELYLSKTQLAYGDRNVNLQNQILFSNQLPRDSEIEILSHYTYGFFNQDLMSARWLGSLSQKNTVTVKKILFNVEKTDYLIDFIDYN